MHSCPTHFLLYLDLNYSYFSQCHPPLCIVQQNEHAGSAVILEALVVMPVCIPDEIVKYGCVDDIQQPRPCIIRRHFLHSLTVTLIVLPPEWLTNTTKHPQSHCNHYQNQPYLQEIVCHAFMHVNLCLLYENSKKVTVLWAGSNTCVLEGVFISLNTGAIAFNNLLSLSSLHLYKILGVLSRHSRDHHDLKTSMFLN